MATAFEARIIMLDKIEQRCVESDIGVLVIIALAQRSLIEKTWPAVPTGGLGISTQLQMFVGFECANLARECFEVDGNRSTIVHENEGAEFADRLLAYGAPELLALALDDEPARDALFDCTQADGHGAPALGGLRRRMYRHGSTPSGSRSRASLP